MTNKRAPERARGFQTCSVVLAMLSLTQIPGKNEENKTTWLLTGFEVHHFGVKSIICDGELGELQFVQPMDVLLALRPVIHDVLRRVAVYEYTAVFLQRRTVRNQGINPTNVTYSSPNPACTPVHP